MIIGDPALGAINWGKDAVNPVGINLNLTNLQKLNLPINCVVAGDQPQEKKTPKFITDPYGILTKIIFGE